MREFLKPKPPQSPAESAPKPDKPLKIGPAAKPAQTSAARVAAGVPNPDWVSAYASAYPGMLSIGGQAKFSSVSASSVSGLWLYVMDENKYPVLQQEIKRSTGDPTESTWRTGLGATAGGRPIHTLPTSASGGVLL